MSAFLLRLAPVALRVAKTIVVIAPHAVTALSLITRNRKPNPLADVPRKLLK